LRALGWVTVAGVLAVGGTALAADVAGDAHKAMGTASEAAGTATQAAANVSDAAKIVAKLHRVNQMEIDAGKMAEDKGSTKAVQDFGAELVRDHEAADKKVLAFAGKAGIDASSTAASSPADQAEDRSDQQNMDQLHHLSGAAFDRQFASAMQEGHAKTITAVTSAQSAVGDKQLKALLGNLLPTLRKHEQTAEKLVNGGAHASTP
jgi:putative membrane protein